MTEAAQTSTSNTETLNPQERTVSSTNLTLALEVGEYLIRSELVELTSGVAAAVTAVKNRMAVTYRSAKFRAQNAHPDREFKIVTSSTPHGDGHVVVTATITREM